MKLQLVALLLVACACLSSAAPRTRAYWCYWKTEVTNTEGDWSCGECWPCGSADRGLLDNTPQAPSRAGYNCRECRGCPNDPSTVFSGMKKCVRKGKPVPALGGDPHFKMESINSFDSLCFDYHGDDGEILNLISDPETGMSINGQLRTWDLSRKRASVFSDFFAEDGNNKLHFAYDGIEIGYEFYSWTMSSSVAAGDFILSPGDRIGVVNLHYALNDVTLAIGRAEGELLGEYLHMYVVNRGSISESTSGLVGQFLYMETSVEPYSDAVEVEEQRMTLTFPDESSRSIPVMSAVRQGEECWYYAPHIGDVYVTAETGVEDPQAVFFEGVKRKGDSLLGLYEQFIVKQSKKI